MRATDINTGSGLQYTVLPDRGLDISLASYKGDKSCLPYLQRGDPPCLFTNRKESAGCVHLPAVCLHTCGLTHLGPPCEDEGQAIGPSRKVFNDSPSNSSHDLSGWEGNDYIYKVRGIIEEGYIFGNKLRMEREISSVRGQNVIRLTDKITNFGSKPSPYTILYHMNFGYPLLSEDAELVIDPLTLYPGMRMPITALRNSGVLSSLSRPTMSRYFFTP